MSQRTDSMSPDQPCCTLSFPPDCTCRTSPAVPCPLLQTVPAEPALLYPVLSSRLYLLDQPCCTLSSPPDCTCRTSPAVPCPLLQTVPTTFGLFENRNLTNSFELYFPARQSTAMNALSIETASEAERNLEASGDSISAQTQFFH